MHRRSLEGAEWMKLKKKNLGGIDYIIRGSTIERVGINIIKKQYTTTKGLVVIEKGKVQHPDGTMTNE